MEIDNDKPEVALLESQKDNEVCLSFSQHRWVGWKALVNFRISWTAVLHYTVMSE